MLAEAEGDAPRLVLIATGSEVQLAMAARRLLAREGIPVRVVSMPSTTVFDRQDEAWRDAVLPPGVPRVAVEAGVRDFWRKYVGLEGAVIGIDRFGESAPAQQLFEQMGAHRPTRSRERRGRSSPRAAARNGPAVSIYQDI